MSAQDLRLTFYNAVKKSKLTLWWYFSSQFKDPFREARLIRVSQVPRSLSASEFWEKNCCVHTRGWAGSVTGSAAGTRISSCEHCSPLTGMKRFSQKSLKMAQCFKAIDPPPGDTLLLERANFAFSHAKWSADIYQIYIYLIRHPESRTRGTHKFKFRVPYANKDVFKFSFFPKTIPHWNVLPETTVSPSSLEIFKHRLTAFLK